MAADHSYIHGMKVNGKQANKTWVSAPLVTHGGTLDYTLFDKPNPTWGTAPDAAPPSFPANGTR